MSNFQVQVGRSIDQIWKMQRLYEARNKQENTWMSLLQSIGSLTTKTACTLSEQGSCLKVTLSWPTPCLSIHFLYCANGSIFLKNDAYSSIERTFLKLSKQVNQWQNIEHRESGLDNWQTYGMKYKVLLETIFGHYFSRFTFSDSNNEFILKSAIQKKNAINFSQQNPNFK